ncbi:MAG: Zn-binding domain-containing protein [Planctomycetota bacterium JB042]
MSTDAFVLLIDPDAAHEAGLYRAGNPAALGGLASLLKQVAPLVVRAAPSDFGVTAEIKSPRDRRPVLHLFDDVPGGVGLCEKIFEARAEVLAVAADVLDACPCPEGCPSCLGPGKGEEAKRVARLLVGGLLG